MVLLINYTMNLIIHIIIDIIDMIDMIIMIITLTLMNQYMNMVMKIEENISKIN